MSSNQETSPTPLESHMDGDAHGLAPHEAETGRAFEELRLLALRVQQQSEFMRAEKTEAGKLIQLIGTQQLALDLDKPVIEHAPQADRVGADKNEKIRVVLPEQPPVNKAPATAPLMGGKMSKAGSLLRETREMQGITLEEVADELKVKISYLQAIEENRYGDLPGRTYAVGIVRNYAQVLGLNDDEMVARARQDVTVALPPTTPHMMPLEENVAHSRAMPGASLVVFCVVFAVFVYAVGYSFFRPAAHPEMAPASLTASLPESLVRQAAALEEKNKAAAIAAAQASRTPRDAQVSVAPPPQSVSGISEPAAALQAPVLPQPETSLAETASPAAENGAAVDLQQGVTDVPRAVKLASPSRIRLQATDQITVQIFDSTGHMLASRIIAKGEAFFIPDKTNYTMATNNAGALRLQVDGRDMPPLGAPQEPMHNIPLNADELLGAMN